MGWVSVAGRGRRVCFEGGQRLGVQLWKPRVSQALVVLGLDVPISVPNVPISVPNVPISVPNVPISVPSVPIGTLIGTLSTL